MPLVVLVPVGLALAFLGSVFLAIPRRVSEVTLGLVSPPDSEALPPDWYVRTTALSGVFKVAAGALVVAIGMGALGS